MSSATVDSPAMHSGHYMHAAPHPANPLDAVVHPDPYPYYASLAARRPFDFDASLGLWVAAGPQAMAEVLRHPACGVRPVGARVPAALANGPAGEWFGALVRMNDGPAHAAMKPWLKARLAGLHADRDALASLRDASQAACADAYLNCLSGAGRAVNGETSAARLDDFVFRQPIYGLAAWLGVPSSQWTDVYGDVHRLVAAMAESARPSARADVIRAGHDAATALRQRATRWLDKDAAPGTWMRNLAQAASRDDSVDFGQLTANLVGLFTQTHDACAGLIANSVRRFARSASAAAAPVDLAVAIRAVGEVIRFDPPVQNTRRFLHASATLCGRTLAKGDVILVVLASAPGDTSPDSPADDVAWTFGRGAHTCPGRSPASTIAVVGVHAILDSGVDLAALATGTAGTAGTTGIAGTTYHPLGNVRIARFAA